MRTIVVIGAGLSGMLTALFIKKRAPASQIVILEQSAHAGGHYREVQLQGFGRCDRAMRLLYETGISELDQIIHDLLPAQEWQVFPDNEKDIAGIYWHGVLQTHSPYIDLRRLPQPVYKQCERDILHRPLNATAAETAADYLQERFGPTSAAYLISVLEKFYHLPASQLDISATHQPAMNRVVLCDEGKMGPLLQDSGVRSLIAWPDQLTLPIKRNPSQAALYPKRFGMNAVIDAMVRQLTEQGVRFHFNCSVAQWEREHDNISALALNDGNRIENPSLVIAANGLQAAFHLLYPQAPATSSAPSCWFVFLRVDKPPRMDRLYHFYCFDEGYATFRVTHYYNYCPDAYDGTGYPLCIELWSQERDPAQAIERAIAELRQMKVLMPECRIIARAAMPAPNLHALCTLEDVKNRHIMREKVKEQSPQNMVTIGPFAEDGVLLLYEVWRDMYRKITAWIA